MAVGFSFTVQASRVDSSFYFTTSDSVQLYVRVAGTGKPCLFVHGGPGSTSYYYEAMAGAPIIEQQMQMIYYDQRGAGRSGSAANRNYTLSRMVDDMEEIREYLGIKQWAVMGHSFGGILITNYALKHQPRLTGIFYINCTVDMQSSMKSHLEFGLKELSIEDQAGFRDTAMPLNERVWKVHDKLTEKNIWYKLMYRNAYEKQFNDSVTLSQGKFNRDFASNCWSIPDYWKSYAQATTRIQCPVFIMTGNRDYAIGTEHFKMIQSPLQTVVHYIGGHAPFQEEPQWYAEKIISFIPQLQ